jgi:hypothetical protein
VDTKTAAQPSQLLAKLAKPTPAYKRQAWFAMAGLVAAGFIKVRDCKNVDTSFPGFVELARHAGLTLEAK